ncbi:MAG: hypothetical protein U5O39_11925 [Gammaproteobacteria bacterium]|nr:hypothetical protein [Gammaproteobacteria bacterium]
MTVTGVDDPAVANPGDVQFDGGKDQPRRIRFPSLTWTTCSRSMPSVVAVLLNSEFTLFSGAADGQQRRHVQSPPKWIFDQLATG